MVGICDDSADLDGLASLLDNVVGEARSEGGLVEVKVDTRGRVSDVWLDDRVSRVPADELAVAIAEVCGAAFNDRLDRLADVISDYDRTQGLANGVLEHLHAAVDRLR
ncbi:YbaB/EbfC family nucleoid-associated protein [Mycobacterium sp. TY815]|uniref:YbaB/EbfC family nucleoid-associated protein n=1 Tax=Mycobacterium sp. TY815 TaxID=3050581 RepID=UPI002741BB06|nr:YbaB/EbfC family nucleoid-associated protein [Mycobacterium sp. TY815]MDP7703364.1 YbaB/EbfC family nucleoid-associated protein [Mycobacterium sp. TY815]